MDHHTIALSTFLRSIVVVAFILFQVGKPHGNIIILAGVLVTRVSEDFAKFFMLALNAECNFNII